MVMLAEVSTDELLQYTGIMMGVMVLVLVAFYWAKRMKRSSEQEVQLDFTLHDLRKLHADGHMTDAEFNAEKAKILGRVAEKKAQEAKKTQDGQ